MKVFLSWSGEKSQGIAEVFNEWLPNVIQSIEPFLSTRDIAKGTEWRVELENQLKNTEIGIFFLTKDNINSPWVAFEAGSLNIKLPFVFDIEANDMIGPLAGHQVTRFNREDIRNLLVTLNNRLGNEKLNDRSLEKLFEIHWPHLVIQLNRFKEDKEEELLIESYYKTLDAFFNVEEKICKTKHPLFQEVIDKELIEFRTKISRWELKRATLPGRDSYEDYLKKVYTSASKNIFATCSINCMNHFLRDKIEEKFLKIHAESPYKVTRVFIFEDEEEVQKEYITRINAHNKIDNITVYVYINDRDRNFDFPPDITQDFTVIDDGIIIGICNHTANSSVSQLIFDNDKEKTRFKVFMEKLIAGSLKEDDALYKKIFY
jgi:hypothetical protein